jgi:hypothetical protein
MKLQSHLVDWTRRAEEWLEANAPQLTRESVTIGRDAWTVAHRAGIINEAYADRNVTDAHIQTALEKIFPNAAFKDKKRY